MNSSQFNDESEKEILFLSSLNKTILYYYLTVLIPIGIVTNTISILIFMRPNMNKTTMGFYNITIAISNILALLCYVFVQNLQVFFNVNFLTLSPAACPLGYLVRRTIRELTPMIEAFVTVDRFCAVFYPRRFKILTNKKKLLAGMFVMYVILVLLSFQNWFFYLRVSKSSNNTTVATCTAIPLVSISSDLVSNLLRVYIPISIMAILNVFIIRKLSETKTKLNKTSNESKDRNFTVTVTSMNLFFIFFNLPVCIVYIVNIVYDNFLVTDRLAKARLTFIFNMFYFMATTYYMMFFFTNLVFNKLFRGEIFLVLKLKIPTNSVAVTNSLNRNMMTDSATRTI
jgi:hypothetical protein